MMITLWDRRDRVVNKGEAVESLVNMYPWLQSYEGVLACFINLLQIYLVFNFLAIVHTFFYSA